MQECRQKSGREAHKIIFNIYENLGGLKCSRESLKVKDKTDKKKERPSQLDGLGNTHKMKHKLTKPKT